MSYHLNLTWGDTTKKIQIIKNVRAVSLLGLKEAKQLVDEFAADEQPRLVKAYDTLLAAREGLSKLREGGYAEGEIVQLAAITGQAETTYTKAEVTLMLVDAIADARAHPEARPSSIINLAFHA